MKPFSKQPSGHHKWGLFVLLAGSLGFSLSMNPSHFNNIARNEDRMETMDLAQTAAGESAAAKARLEREKEAKEKAEAEKKAAAEKAEAEKSEKASSDKSDSDISEMVKLKNDLARELDLAKKEREEAAKARAEAADKSKAEAKPAASGNSSSSSSSSSSNSKSDSTSMLVSGSKGSFRATVFKQNDKTYATFESTENVEGRECELCKGDAKLLKSSIDKISDLQTELLAYVNGSKSEDKKEEKKVAQKKGEATEVKIEDWAKSCDKDSEEDKLSCHANRLTELSKYLKNSSETDKIVMDYFKTYIQADLRAGFYDRTTKTTSAIACETEGGQVLYQVSMGRVLCQTKGLEDSQRVADEILNGLRAGNSKSVVTAIAKMKAGSYSAQLRNTQTLAREAINDGDQARLRMVNQSFSQLRGIFTNDSQVMLNEVAQMEGSKAQINALNTAVGNSFFTPVDTMLNNLNTFTVNGTPNNQTQSHTFLDFQVPSLGDDRGSMSLTTLNNINAGTGMPGNIPASLLATRVQASRSRVVTNSNWPNLGTSSPTAPWLGNTLPSGISPSVQPQTNLTFTSPTVMQNPQTLPGSTAVTRVSTRAR